MRLLKNTWAAGVRAARPGRVLLQLLAIVGVGAWSVASCGGSGSVDACQSYASACGQRCSEKEACNLGLHCTNGSCAADCTPKSGCGNGQVCSILGVCTAPTLGIDGTPCATSVPACPTGYFCSSGACTAECWPGGPDCGSGFCSSSGHCSDPSLSSDSGDPGTGGFFQGDGCINQSVGWEGLPPTVLLLIDTSGSMSENFPEGQKQTTRWSVLRDALMDAKTGAVKSLQSSVRLSAMWYSSQHGSGPGKVCPILTPQPAMPLALNNYNAINAVYQVSEPNKDTPTPESIRAATAELAAFKEPGPKYILLVTDGLPDTCEDPDANAVDAAPARQVVANQASVKATQDAYAQGVGLIIMGVSNDIAPDHLQQMANAGAGKPPETTGAGAAAYYVAQSDQSALAKTLSSIWAAFEPARSSYKERSIRASPTKGSCSSMARR